MSEHKDEEYIRLVAKVVAQETVETAHKRHKEDIMQQMPIMIAKITEDICERFNTQLSDRVSDVLGTDISDREQVRELQDTLSHARVLRKAREESILTLRQVVTKRAAESVVLVVVFSLGVMMAYGGKFIEDYGTFFFGEK